MRTSFTGEIREREREKHGGSIRHTMKNNILSVVDPKTLTLVHPPVVIQGEREKRIPPLQGISERKK